MSRGERIDVVIEDNGSIWLLVAKTKQAKRWFARHIENLGAQPDVRLGDWRPMRDIVLTMEAEGFNVNRGNTSPLCWR